MVVSVVPVPRNPASPKVSAPLDCGSPTRFSSITVCQVTNGTLRMLNVNGVADSEFRGSECLITCTYISESHLPARILRPYLLVLVASMVGSTYFSATRHTNNLSRKHNAVIFSLGQALYIRSNSRFFSIRRNPVRGCGLPLIAEVFTPYGELPSNTY
jgi:hypothetical protein